MINKAKNFFSESYRRDPLATVVEIFETVILVTASATLTFTVLDPATHIFIPLYWVGSICAMFSTWRRKSTAFVLCCWFTIMNSIALVTLIYNGIFG
tara:strand:- start:26134 stop:26424 length:291 start_codon:yes stop_codon:yes gene_type:complete